MNFDHIVSILNTLVYPALGVMVFFYQKSEAAKKDFQDKVDTEMKAINAKIDANRDESFKNFVPQKSFEKLEKTMDKFRDRLEDVAIAVGASKRRQDGDE